MMFTSNEKVNMSAFKRVSKLYDASDLNKLKSIQLFFHAKQNQKLPRKTKTMLPNMNLKVIKTQQKLNAIITLFLSVIIMIGSYYEVESMFSLHYKLDHNNNILRMVMVGLSIIQLMLILSYYYNMLKIKISYKIVSKHSHMYQDNETLLKLMLELLICSMVIPPYIEFSINVAQISKVEVLSLDDIMISFIFLRIYTLYKLYFEFSYFNSLKARFYCDLQSVLDVFKFTMRCFLKDKPWTSIMIMFTLSTLLIGILLHVFEQSVPGSPFKYVWNAFWLVSYTQSTIGYGEITPSTHLGRLCIVICSFVGLFMYSYIVLIVRNSSELTVTEAKLYSEIKYKQKGMDKIRVPGVVLIQRWWRLMLKRRIRISTINDIFKFQRQLQEFSLQRRKELQEKNPTISEEVKKASKTFTKKLNDVNSYLESVEMSEHTSVRLANMHFTMLSKLNAIGKGLRRYANKQIESVDEPYLRVGKSVRRVSAVSSRAAIRKMRGDAVKKLIQTKIKKNSVVISSAGSLSSDEDFYSSKNSSRAN